MQLAPPPRDKALSPDHGEGMPPLDLRPMRGALRGIAEVVALILVVLGVWRLAFADAAAESIAMSPAIAPDEHVLASRVIYWLASPHRGDIVAVRDAQGDFVLRRVLGVPGDRVEIRDLQVLVNGQLAGDPALSTALPTGAPAAEVRLKPGEFFVLADNPPLTASPEQLRKTGLLQLDQIPARAWLTYWPPDAMGLVKHTR